MTLSYCLLTSSKWAMTARPARERVAKLRAHEAVERHLEANALVLVILDQVAGGINWPPSEGEGSCGPARRTHRARTPAPARAEPR